ncbi:MAG: DNA topoisomerase (ATP-hydrolyzing) subunit A, partial [Defluviitaleaceae bacterium]|nr:DNA topoisomerase (ATP-hydrolyzing) subunit A [Defluviitaleaceae bacterium]
MPAKSNKTAPPAVKEPNPAIEQNIVHTLETNYMPYVMSVIISRAIPEIDGFKPAHRKLLYTMYKMGLLNGGRSKSTDVVGATMRLNPHGDAAIYETLVRLTRGNGALLHPFIDSKGNFGKAFSRDMAYAASRYTEVRLDPICEELFADIDKDTVDMVDNYSGTMKEPLLFPTTFPNLLVTPNQGIAVGMASSVCSFNLKEVCDAATAYLKNRNISLQKYLLAPDFSTGGELLYNEKEIAAIYETGRGSFKVRAKYRYDKKNSCIEIYEIPYSTTIEVIVDRIVQLVKANKIRDINDVRDETDLGGLKITLDIKRAADPDLIMRKLYGMTTLCDSFACNFNFLVNGRPRTMGVAEILDEWIAFRMGAVRRRLAFDIAKTEGKLHLLEGLSAILLDIDKAIRIIRQTAEDKQVIPNLMAGFDIDEDQANYIAEIRLRNLNREYLLNRANEMDGLRKELAEMRGALGSEEKIRQMIADDLKSVSKKYGKPRATDIIREHEVEPVAEDELIDDYGVRLFLTAGNYFKKISLVSLRSSGDHNVKQDDRIIQEIEATNKSDVLFFSNKCSVYKARAYDLPDCKASGLGEYLTNLLSLEDGEAIVRIAATADYSGLMLFAFANGKAAKIPMSAYETKTNRKKLINAYSDKSPLVFCAYIAQDADFFAMRDKDKAILFNSGLISPVSSKNSAGVQVFTLKKNSALTAVCPAEGVEAEDIEYYRTGG